MVEPSQNAPTPFLKAILMCDMVIVDDGSKKKTLVGLFDVINVAKFPIVHSPLAIYARLVDAEGQYSFRLDYVQVKTDKLLLRADIPATDIKDRLKATDLIFRPPPIPIPEPGQYEFRLWANNKYLGRAEFTAVETVERKE